jgi:hypothetical protein
MFLKKENVLKPKTGGVEKNIPTKAQAAHLRAKKSMKSASLYKLKDLARTAAAFEIDINPLEPFNPKTNPLVIRMKYSPKREEQKKLTEKLIAFFKRGVNIRGIIGEHPENRQRRMSKKREKSEEKSIRVGNAPMAAKILMSLGKR